MFAGEEDSEVEVVFMMCGSFITSIKKIDGVSKYLHSRSEDELIEIA